MAPIKLPSPANYQSPTDCKKTMITFVTIQLLILLSPSAFCLPVDESPFLPGACPKVNPVTPVDLSLYSGSWRQVALFPNVTAPLVGHGYKPDLLCVTVK